MLKEERLKEIEDKLLTIKHTYEELLPVWNIVDRKKQTLELQIKLLRDEREKINSGQMLLSFDEKF